MWRVRILMLLLLAAAVGAAAMLYFRATPAAAPPADRPATPAPEAASAPLTGAAPARPDSAAAPPAAPPPAGSTGGFETRFKVTPDLLAFLDSVIGSARQGDPLAAWYAYRALHRCDREYEIFFGPKAQALTLDQALARNTSRFFFPDEEFRRLHRQCERMRNADLAAYGDAETWLERAARAKEPMAQMRWANKLLIDVLNKRGDLDALRAEARTLIKDSLRSKRADVMFQAGDTISLLDLHEDLLLGTVWTMAACQRGFDCSTSNEEGFMMLCRWDKNCQPYETGVDILRRNLTAAEYDEAERRAREINSSLDADRFDDLGI